MRVGVFYVGYLMLAIARAAAVHAAPSIDLKLAWDKPPVQTDLFKSLGYEVVISEAGQPARTLFIPEAESAGGVCSVTLSNLDQDSTYSFKCCTVYESTDLPTVRTNSIYTPPVVFKTGRIVSGDVTPPVVTCDANPFETWATSAVLSGTVFDDSHLSMQLHGDFESAMLAYNGSGGKWSAQVELKALKPTPITIEARDIQGNTTIITNEIVIVAPPPTPHPSPRRWAPNRSRPQPGLLPPGQKLPANRRLPVPPG